MRARTLLCSTAAVLGLYYAISAAPAVAQAVVASITRNIDEPGRNPYESTVVFNAKSAGTDGAICQGNTCVVPFGPVPQGFRLVLRNITGMIRLVPSGRIALMSLGGDDPAFPHLSLFPVMADSYVTDGTSSQIYPFNSAVSGYVESPLTPVLTITGGNAFLNATQNSQVKLTGYLIDLSR